MINHIVNSWYVEHGQNIIITYDSEFVRSEDGATMGMDNKHIIAVGDDENNLQLVSSILQTQNIRVTEMHSGLDLIDYVQNVDELPDMVLLDARMPEMDGYEVLLLRVNHILELVTLRKRFHKIK